MPYYPANVRAEMARKRLTNEEVAKRAKKSTSTIQAATSDDGNPTKETIEAIATAIEVDPVIFWIAPPKHEGTPHVYSSAG